MRNFSEVQIEKGICEDKFIYLQIFHIRPQQSQVSKLLWYFLLNNDDVNDDYMHYYFLFSPSNMKGKLICIISKCIFFFTKFFYFKHFKPDGFISLCVFYKLVATGKCEIII